MGVPGSSSSSSPSSCSSPPSAAASSSSEESSKAPCPTLDFAMFRSDGLRLRGEVKLSKLGVKLGLRAFGSKPTGAPNMWGRSRKGVEAALPG
jgi:hypothetical protein